MDRLRIQYMAEAHGYDALMSTADLYLAVERYLAGPDQSFQLREGSTELRDLIMNEWATDLTEWVHRLAPELCHCQQCGYMRDDIERIKKMHGAN